ncbi:MAG: 3'-5' exonuclease [Faecalibacterium sp.]
MSLQAEFLTLRDQYIEKQFGRLNAKQKEAVFTTEGPLLILAGAGSGKTTVLVNRIANIIRFGTAHGSSETPRAVGEDDLAELKEILQTGAAPSYRLAAMLRRNNVRAWNVMAITFTNKAAGELKERLQAMLGETDGADVFAATFHSACVRILRRHGEELGYPSSFTIYDSDDSLRAMKAVYKELSVDDKFLPVKSALGQISRLKDKLISPKEAAGFVSDTKAGIVARVYATYQKRLRDAGALDFDDLIYQTVMLLQNHPEIRSAYQDKYQYLLVDEYQDTSVAQFQLVRLLTGGQRNICVVGDDDQSIYKFRGATIENILSFEQMFVGAKTIRLEENYRSTSNILNAANCVIQNNQGRKGKTLWTKNGDGEKIQHYEAENEMDEAKHLVEVIGNALKEGAHLSDFAVLYRMNAQSSPIETYFTRAGVPHKILGGQRFNDRKEVKDIHSYMSIVANAKDDLRLRRIINEPARKIGATTLENMAQIATAENISMLEVCSRAPEYTKISRAAAALFQFYVIYQRLCQAAEDYPLDVFVTELLRITGYKAMLEGQGEEGQERLQNLGQLVNNVKSYQDQKGAEATLSGYLEEIALISDLDQYNQDNDQVVMMTIHSAKGLEFPYVFLVGLEEGIFPGDRTKYSEEDLEEERRLCYVGITRAKKTLYLSSSASRMLFGQTRRNEPSRFLEEIDTNYIETVRSPALACKSQWGSEYGTVPGGASGYSGTSGWGKTANYHNTGADENGYPAKAPSGGAGYLNREYNAGERAEAQRRYGGGGYNSGFASGGHSGWSSGASTPRMGTQGGYDSGYGGATKPSKPIQIGVQATQSGAKPAASDKNYKVGDVVDHKVFGRGTIQRVAPTAGDNILEIRFEKVGVKKTMANFAPLTKVK